MIKLILAFLILTLVAGSTQVSAAADLEDEIQDIENQRSELEKKKEAQQQEIDEAQAKSEQLAEALAVLNQKVADTESRLEKAEAYLSESEQRLSDAQADVAEVELKVEGLEEQVADRAISAFVGRSGGGVSVANNREPQVATRMRTMVGEATDRDFDVAEELRATREDLAFKRAEANAAKEQADRAAKQIEADLKQLEKDRDAQAKLAAEAEDQLDRELFEQQLLVEKDSELAELQKTKYSELQQQLAAANARSGGSGSSTAGVSYPSNDQIVKVGPYWVHVDIAENVRKLLAAASADGYNFGGWAYRDHQAQIRLRKAHCGSSSYAIYQMSSSSCRPPTARPGRSMHEQGKAIDFTYNGGSISSRRNAGYKWLAANASKYGLYNLPSEPWHWSTNGN